MNDYYRRLGIIEWNIRKPYLVARNEDVPVIARNEVTKQSPGIPKSPSAPRDNSWESLQQRVIACTACSLHTTRTQTVFGVGNRNAKLMIIGEAPGFYEDQKGEPFVGRAGQLLNAMLKAIGFSREQVFIANILKCRPPNNRDPDQAEVATCTPFLDQQIHLVQPQLILAVGRIAAHFLLKTKSSLEVLRNKLHCYGEKQIPLIITYHPAYLLRNPADKKKAYQDLLFALRTLDPP